MIVKVAKSCLDPSAFRSNRPFSRQNEIETHLMPKCRLKCRNHAEQGFTLCLKHIESERIRNAKRKEYKSDWKRQQRQLVKDTGI